MKRLIKLLFCVLSVISLIAVYTVSCSAESAEIDINRFGGAELYESIPEETQNLFEKLGISSISFDSVFNVDGERIVELIKNLVTGCVESPLKSTVRLMAVIIILAVFECFVPDDSKILSVMELAGVLFCTVSIINPITTAISSAVASVTIAEKFMLVLIPVLTSVISISGNPTLAFSFQSIAFVAAQIISAVASGVVVPIVGMVLALDISGSLMPKFRLSALTSVVKKSLATILSFSATIFVSFLGLKAGLANTADTLVSKGIKLVISSAVPVVGGALSEAYSGVAGSMALVKSTVGVFGIGAIALIALPSCIQLLFWIFALRFSAGIADMFEHSGIGNLLRSLASSLVLLNVVLVFVAVLFIISTSLVLILKAG